MRPPTKKRKIAAPARIEEISFNPESRKEYLTGFHKRKVQRAKRSDNSEQEEGDEEEWNGIVEPPPVDYEAEYIDEDKYTTVTVEEIEATKGGLVTRRDGAEKSTDTDEEGGEEGAQVTNGAKPKQKTSRAKDNPNKDIKKKRKRKRDFKYESPLERKMNRAKERGRKKKQAEARKAKKG
ncbi:rRNA processing protein Rrp17 [Microsporum canis CBS 113480]|uniref:rRNA processing protein Rrp17 n=1 Tax=Arthroderma otae (strain ATCC MYA-4605 / CBS 113480) TaxID=554155 RepID=C5FYF0_ARTOC|nr:rRNA processing protein Rrp17 [Microsporum canis CBS 113480]EEQ34548.1 rRNA processing protein Rrp17 [Microsporum canis CBS 113480]